TLAGLALLLLPVSLRAQAPSVPKSMTLYGFFGYSRNVSNFPNPVPGLSQDGVAGSFRFMWHPEHLLSFGVDVGLTQIYQVNQVLSDGSALHSTLDALPIQFVFSMSPWKRVSLNVGTGPTFSRSHVTSLGNTTSSSAFGASFMGSVLYMVPVGKGFGVGGELKYLRTTTYDDNNLVFSVALAWRFHQW
ncbi:MAG TPA: hypothetical protein VMJ30_05405, partial [Gemmatimonadales bacterium]|nr:hypothetical protein [Gemmatimonadales bacterium]